MAVIKSTTEEIDPLAKFMRSEDEDELGMLLVGNVGVNRVLAKCMDFEDINTITKMVYQDSGGFEAVNYQHFYQADRYQDIDLAKLIVVF